MIRFVILVLTAELLLCSCVSHETQITSEAAGSTRSILQIYDSVHVADGLDQHEAVIMANEYFLIFISGCGGACGASDLGEEWEVSTKYGYAAEPFDPILVHKKTGRITCAKGPTLEYPGRIVKSEK